MVVVVVVMGTRNRVGVGIVWLDTRFCMCGLPQVHKILELVVGSNICAGSNAELWVGQYVSTGIELQYTPRGA